MKAFIVIVFASFIGLTRQASWSYHYETQWPGVCNTGQQQSPINIMTRDALVDVHEAHIRGPMVFRGYGSVNVTAINNGHTLKWNGVPDTPAPVMSGGPLRGNYTFLQFHLHWLSEHAIDGMKYPMEIHMVHVKTGLTVEEALLRPDGLAVLGVLCQVHSGGNSEHALEQLMPLVPSLTEHNESQSASKIIDITRLFSPSPQSFYTYHGSLTTPYCQEVVTWIVMDTPLHISDTQYTQFQKVNVGGVDNYRSLQRSSRVVYRSVTSNSSMMTPSYLGFLLTAISYLAGSLTSAVGKGWCTLANMKKKLFGDKLSACKAALS